MRYPPLAERLAARLIPDGDGCLLWQGPVNGSGYGYIRDGERRIGVHVAAWEVAHGRRLPEGMVVDHLCRTTTCCAPAHLEAVTQAENIRRSKTTLCKRGHTYDGIRNGHRWCRRCDAERSAAYRARRAEPSRT